LDRKGAIIDSDFALQEMLGYREDELQGVELGPPIHSDNVKGDVPCTRN
jgi:hypothetical protein